jgi:hypothetical protein
MPVCRDGISGRPMFVTLSSMNYPDEPPPSWDTSDVADARAEALDVISDALQWRLADTRWQGIEQLLVAMGAALEADDLGALTAATVDLELAGPLRMTRIGATPVVPPPPPVRDRLNRLVYSLGGAQATQREAPEQAGSDDDSAFP